MVEANEKKVLALPANPLPNFKYFVQNEIRPEYVDFYITDKDGKAKAVGNTVMINALIAKALLGLPSSGTAAGNNGKEVEIGLSATHIQWRLGTGTWQNLIPILTLKGDPGPKGDTGVQGVDGGTLLVANEVPAGSVNGINATFTTAFDFVPGKVDVFINGVKQKYIRDFLTSGTRTILMSESLASTDDITVNYVKT